MKSLTKYIILLFLSFSFSFHFEDLLKKKDPIPFDIYTFEITWITSSTNHPNIKNCFLIHGLWPSKLDGSEIANCNTGSKIKLFISNQTRAELSKSWITNMSGMTDESFWLHEIKNHGRCYIIHLNKTQDEYFSKSMRLYNYHKMRDMLEKLVNGRKSGEFEIDYDNLMNILESINKELVFNIRCLYGNVLSAIRIYFDMDFNPIPEYKLVHNTQRTNCYLGKKIRIPLS
jgi:ribonuclease T2